VRHVDHLPRKVTLLYDILEKFTLINATYFSKTF